MIDYTYITGPLIGGVIGYITNALAIRMLFRPYKAKYIFGFKVPFTPGIIPKEKGRIAASIGGAISENLMSKEVLERNLLSDDMVGKIRSALTDFSVKQMVNDETLRESMLHYLSESEVDTAIASVEAELSSQVASRLGDSQMGAQIADVVADSIVNKIKGGGLVIGGVVGTLLGGSVRDKLADAIGEPVRKFLTKNINNLLSDKGPEIVNNLLSNEIKSLSATPVRKLLEGHEQQIAQFIDTVVGLYQKLISDQLPKILATINIPLIIEGRINEMDMRETERLIFTVMDKELRAIIWLGALLGIIMGCVNAFL